MNYADVLAPCVPACRPVAELSSICDIDADFDDNDEEVEDLVKLQCLCLNPSFDVAGLTALCASCITQNALPSDLDDDTDDITEIMRRCGFASAVWTRTPTPTAATGRVEVVASRLTASAQITTTVDFVPRPTCSGRRKHGNRGKEAVVARHPTHGDDDDETEEEDMADDTNSTRCFVPGKWEDDGD